MINKLNNIQINGSSEKPILIDISLKSNSKPKDLIIFCHGFKGFKDWGPFNKIADYFAKKDFVFVKFNFSFNGISKENGLDFNDLKAFGNNNFSKELDDLNLVINWVFNNDIIKSEINFSKISLFGHSRGGGISILKSAEDSRITNVISWASPSSFLDRLPSSSKLAKWKEMGVLYAYNGRTKQNMPMYYQFYEDCLANSNRLNIENAASLIKVPFLVIHGSDDPTVPLSDAHKIKYNNEKIFLHVISGADHVFGGYHPYDQITFPKDLQEAIDVTIKFLKE